MFLLSAYHINGRKPAHCEAKNSPNLAHPIKLWRVKLKTDK